MNNKAVFCNEFITDGINSEMCNAYGKISLPIYPSVYEMKTFCKTANHLRCPIRGFSTIINLSRTETTEIDGASSVHCKK